MISRFRFTCDCSRLLAAASRSYATARDQPQPTASRTAAAAASGDPVGSSTPQLTHWRVTLLRSPLKLPKPAHDALRNLGLRRRMAVRYRKHTKENAGLILQVKELLKVENVTMEEYRVGRKSTRKLIGDNRGYRVVGNILKDRVRERERILGEMDAELERENVSA